MSYIKIDRAIIDSYVFAHPGMLKLWIWLLCKARWTDGNVSMSVGRGTGVIEIKRGQLIFGRNSAEDSLCIDGSTIYKWMQKFEEQDMIEIQSNNQFTVVTICKYDDYQSIDSNEVTIKEPDNNQIVTTLSPDNNIKNNIKQIKKNNTPPNGKVDFDFKQPLLKLGADQKLVDEWLLVRKKKRGVNTETAFNLFIKQVGSDNINDILTLCISKSWAGFDREWINNQSKQTQSDMYLSQADCAVLTDAINSIQDDQWQTVQRGIILNSEYNAMYVEKQSKFVPFSTVTSCERLKAYAISEFKKRGIYEMKFNPASYGKK